MSSASSSPHRSADTLWKTLEHVGPESFDFRHNGATEVCWFEILDNRLITVSAAGHKRTIELGHTPPLAMAETIAAELFQAAEQTPVTSK